MLIREVFEQFLAEQQETLKQRTYNGYATAIHLFEHSLHAYAWNFIEDVDTAYRKAEKEKKHFIDLYDHTHIIGNVREFLNYFLTRKVAAGNEFMYKTCPRVVRKLLKWMREKELIEITDETIKDLCKNEPWEERILKFSKSLPYQQGRSK